MEPWYDWGSIGQLKGNPMPMVYRCTCGKTFRTKAGAQGHAATRKDGRTHQITEMM